MIPSDEPPAAPASVASGTRAERIQFRIAQRDRPHLRQYQVSASLQPSLGTPSPTTNVKLAAVMQLHHLTFLPYSSQGNPRAEHYWPIAPKRRAARLLMKFSELTGLGEVKAHDAGRKTLCDPKKVVIKQMGRIKLGATHRRRSKRSCGFARFDGINRWAQRKSVAHYGPMKALCGSSYRPAYSSSTRIESSSSRRRVCLQLVRWGKS